MTMLSLAQCLFYIPPPKKSLIFPPKNLVNCVRLFRLDSLLQVYRCSSEWKTTSLYCISLLSANACSGTCNDTSQTLYCHATAVCVQNGPLNRKNSPHNAPKVAIWRPKIEKIFWGGGARPPQTLLLPPN